MPKPLPERKISVTVNYRGWIEVLKTMGPIVHPVTVTEKKALQMVMMGLEVVEHVKLTGQTIKLNLDNIRDPHRYGSIDLTAVAVEKRPGVDMSKANPDPADTKKDEENETPAPPAEPETPPVPEKTPEEIAAEEDAKKESTGPLAKDYEFSYNKNGSVDETAIPWQSFSKNQRRLLRERINEINAKSGMPKI